MTTSVQVMALESPLSRSPAPTHIISPFSSTSGVPYNDYPASATASISPSSPSQSRYSHLSARSSSGSSLYPTSSLADGISPASANISSPMDLVGPSPVTSNGTETTEFDDDLPYEMDSNHSDAGTHDDARMLPSRAESEQTIRQAEVTSADRAPAALLKRLSTSAIDEFRSTGDEESVSVIHAPQGFGKFVSRQSSLPIHVTEPPPIRARPASAPPVGFSPPRHDRKNGLLDAVAHVSGRSTPVAYDVEGKEPSPVQKRAEETSKMPLPPPPPIATNIMPMAVPPDLETPRAQTREEAESFRASLLRNSSLEGIPEEKQEDDHSEIEVEALKTALHECWTLCNTLASLSSIHRARIFNYSSTGDAHEIAWKCCWKLCKKLYDDRDEDHELHVRPTLDLCRDFCQALFDVRQRKDEVADSVLRVSFELNTHLYNTHDRSLPEAFRERTLDFYITLCHRLMKQRSDLAEETDALLRACWGLAEMLFSLRQNARDGKVADEELLGSAVQACWTLCDLFREGWTQIHLERGTPRPSQTTFTQISNQMSRSSHNHSKSQSLTSVSEDEGIVQKGIWLPETPTTEFDETPISPDLSPHIPNIMVLGSEQNRATAQRWSSNSSTSSLSSYSKGSTNSTATVTNPEDINLTRLKVLIIKAALNTGFVRGSSSGSKSSTSTVAGAMAATPLTLQNFVKTLSTGSFGTLASHATLLSQYRALVLGDPAFRHEDKLPPPGTRVAAADMAKSVKWMMRSGQYGFLRELFRFVCGFQIEEAETRKGMAVAV